MRLHTPSVRQLSGVAALACSAALIPAAALAAAGPSAAPGAAAHQSAAAHQNAAAHVILNVLAPSSCDHPVNATLYAYLPGQAERQSTRITQPFCPNVAPAGVDSMHPLAGVPYYTIR